MAQVPVIDPPTARSAKRKAADELRELAANTAYLALFLCAFTAYRALVSGELRGWEVLVHLGTSVVIAVVIAKTVLIGHWLNLGRRSTTEQSPLVFQTLYESVVYGVFVFVVSIAEKILLGWFHGSSASVTLSSLARAGWQEIAARSVVIFLALIPYFALRELAHLEGIDQVYRVFFRRRPSGASRTTQA